MYLLPRSLKSGSFPCSPVLEGLTWEPGPPSPALGWYAASNGTATRQPSSYRGWKNRPWIQLLSGAATSKISLPPIGRGGSISSPPGSRAPPSPSRAGAKGRKTSVGSGRRSYECYAQLGPDGSFLRTYPASSARAQLQTDLEGRSVRYCEVWPSTGTMRNGGVSKPPISAPPRNGTGSSSWPTARAQDSYERSNQRTVIRASEGEAQMTLSRKVRAWENLPADRTQKERWHTPSVTPEDLFAPKSDGRRGLTLFGQAKLWPTPDAGVSTRTNRSDSPGAADRPLLAKAVKNWPIPTTGDPTGQMSGDKRDTWRPSLEMAARGYRPRKIPSEGRIRTLDETDPGPAAIPTEAEPPSPAEKKWATPRAIYGDHPGMEDQHHLTGQARAVEENQRTWATPTSTEMGKHSPGHPERKQNSVTRQAVKRNWGTPTSHDSKDGFGGNEPTKALLSRQASRAGLQDPTKQRSGPGSSADGPGSPPPSPSPKWRSPHGSHEVGHDPRKLTGTLGHRMYLNGQIVTTDATTQARILLKNSRVRLNPAFVEYLMGFRSGWSLPTESTVSVPSGTPSALLKRPKRSASSSRAMPRTV